LPPTFWSVGLWSPLFTNKPQVIRWTPLLGRVPFLENYPWFYLSRRAGTRLSMITCLLHGFPLLNGMDPTNVDFLFSQDGFYLQPWVLVFFFINPTSCSLFSRLGSVGCSRVVAELGTRCSASPISRNLCPAGQHGFFLPLPRRSKAVNYQVFFLIFPDCCLSPSVRAKGWVHSLKPVPSGPLMMPLFFFSFDL